MLDGISDHITRLVTRYMVTADDVFVFYVITGNLDATEVACEAMSHGLAQSAVKMAIARCTTQTAEGLWQQLAHDYPHLCKA